MDHPIFLIVLVLLAIYIALRVVAARKGSPPTSTRRF